MAHENNNASKIWINNLTWYAVGVLDYLNTAMIYVFYLTPLLKEILLKTLQFVFFPIYAVNTIVYAVLGLVNLIYDRDKDSGKVKTENVIRLIVNTLSAVLVTTAVVGTLAFAGVMGVATSFLFAANILVTAGFNFGGAGYHLYQYRKKGQLLKNLELAQHERDILEHERKRHQQKSIGYLAIGGTITLAAIGGSLAVLGGFMPLAAIGILAGVIGIGFCIYAIVKTSLDKKREREANGGEAQALLTAAAKQDSTPKILKSLSQNLLGKPAPKPTREQDEVLTPLLKHPSENVDDVSSDDDLLHSPAVTHQQRLSGQGI